MTGAEDPTDAALVARWQSGDQRAATLLVQRHAEPIARFIASLGERNDVDEVVQDTFVRAFSSLDGFRGESSLRTWLLTIARNLLRDRVRAARPMRHHIPVEENHAVTDADPLETALADETEQRLHAAMARLSPMQREVFQLRVTEGISYKQIAEVVGSTEGAARVHYHNAMRSIKEFLNA